MPCFLNKDSNTFSLVFLKREGHTVIHIVMTERTRVFVPWEAAPILLPQRPQERAAQHPTPVELHHCLYVVRVSEKLGHLLGKMFWFTHSFRKLMPLTFPPRMEVTTSLSEKL